MMSESSCVNCGAQIIPEGARSCDNCGMPVSGAAPPQEEEEAPRLEAPADAQTPAPSPPVEQPISFLPPTREAQQNRVRRGWPTRLTLREKDVVLMRRYIVAFVVALVVALMVVATMAVLEALQTGGRPCIVVGTTRWCL